MYKNKPVKCMCQKFDSMLGFDEYGGIFNKILSLLIQSLFNFSNRLES